MTEDRRLFIHLYTCPDCGADTRADRTVPCFKCGTEMNHQKKIGEVTHSVQDV